MWDLQEMLSFVNEGEEAFFDTTDQLLLEEQEEEEAEMCGNSDYDLWLSEPQSVSVRRANFLSRMGFVESSGASVSVDDNVLSERRKSNSEANCSADYSDQDWLDDMSIDVDREIDQIIVSSEQCGANQVEGESPTIGNNQKKKKWWRHFTHKVKKHVFTESKLPRIRTEANRKKFTECSAVYNGQQLQAHNGLIWTIKFSPDGQYLASGGEDGLVCVWRVTTVDASPRADECSFHGPDTEDKPSPRKMKSVSPSVIIPAKIFHIQEEPVHKFQGHTGDVLDLAWSKSNHLLSSSVDKTVRLWQAGSDKCLGVFHHSNYVTCVQFNPVDESYFISGSIDGKVRIWGIRTRRVEDWANVRDIVTAVCYQPNGKGFVVGSVSGICRFYEISGDELMLNAEMNIRGKKKSSGNRITGIQFLKNESQRVMVTSEDSKIRILDGAEVVRKYRGLTKSGSQTSASFTSTGNHIVSIGEDSRIYLWNYDDPCIPAAKQAKSTRSCESFISEGVSIVLPWSDSDIEHNSFACRDSPSSVLTQDHHQDRFSLANWFSMDGPSRAAVTWPEEKLPLWAPPSEEHDPRPCSDHLHQHKDSRIGSDTWGLVFVTANLDGTIRTFHNYGLPARL